jgi:Protein of unknown function (DUF4242)
MQFKTGPASSGRLPVRIDAGSPVENLAPVARGECPCNLSKERFMPKFVIEREIPGAGKMSPAELKTISKKSCGVLSSLGPSVHWINSYVTADKIYCVYHAADESLIRRHAELGGFPANKISMVTTLIDPATAE